MSAITADHPPMARPRHVSDIEADLEGLRVYQRDWPLMRSYIEPKREALREELRAARKADYRAPVRVSFARRLFGALSFLNF